MVLAAINVPQVLALVVGLVGLAGVIFTALRYNRDDTTAIVQQQSVIVGDMKGLNEELRKRTEELREENERLRTQVDKLTAQIEELNRGLTNGGKT